MGAKRKNLGWANGWASIDENIKARTLPYQVEPPELQACRAKDH